MSTVSIQPAELNNVAHQQAILTLLDMYAREPIIDGNGIREEVRENLIDGLRAQPQGHHFLAYQDDTAIGMAICFQGFSTFHAKPLLNIHDLAVHRDYRGRGVGRKLLAAVEQLARQLGCCKLTLEVKHENTGAKRLYERIGFDAGGPPGAEVAFMTKPLGD